MLISPVPLVVGEPSKDMFERLYVPPALREDGGDYYQYVTADRRRQTDLLSTTREVFGDITKNLRSLNPEFRNAQLVKVNIITGRTALNQAYCPGEAPLWHVDPKAPRHLDVLAANFYSTEYLVGSFPKIEGINDDDYNTHATIFNLLGQEALEAATDLTIHPEIPAETGILMTPWTFHRAPINTSGTTDERMLVAATYQY